MQCVNFGFTLDLDPDTCVPLMDLRRRLWAALASPGPFYCEGEPELGPPSVAEVAEVCTCESEGCAEETSGRACILRSGDQSCPDDTPYTERSVFFDTLIDERSCDCGWATCDGSLLAYFTTSEATAMQACEDAAPASLSTSLEACSESVTGQPDVVVRFDSSASSCEREGAATVVGELRLIEPVTICCVPTP